MQLFRPEALRGQDRLHGDVVLVPPISWQLLGGFLVGAILVAILFLSTASYSKVTTVSGRLTGDKGVIRALPARSGIIEAVLVKEGERVEAGAPLARISLVTSDGASSLEARRSAAIARREAILQGRQPRLTRASKARIAALRAQMDGDRAEIESIRSQIEEQRALVRSASADLDRAREVAERGFLSGRDILQREEQLSTRKQGLSRLEQELSVRDARIGTAEAELERAQSELELEMADLASARAELSGLAAADENVSSILVTAAEAGTITGIAVHPGDRVSPERPIMSLIPEGTRLQARIEVPPAAAGFLEAGQTIRIAVDAFPYQTYGTVEAKIDTISMTTVPVNRPDGSAGEVFLVDGSLATQNLAAYGQQQPLRPGMTVNARIRTRSRSLGEWLFDPLFAVGRR